MDCGDSFSDFFQETHLGGAASPEDIFSLLESLDGEAPQFPPPDIQQQQQRQEEETGLGTSQIKSASSSTTAFLESENELEGGSPMSKRQKVSTARESSEEELAAPGGEDGQQKASHITVERNRRKQMNEHLSVLRSLMPCFYVKRGDQASVIGGVVDYITELQQVLQSLEAKKQRKVIYNEVISPRLIPSPRPSPLALSPRKPPLSPRIMNLPISPRTPTPTSPYKPRTLPIMQQRSGGGGGGGGYLSPTTTNTTTMIPTASLDPSPCNSSSTTTSSVDIANELVANSKSAVADVEVKFAGANVLLKTVSPRIQGQVVKIMSAIDDLALEILHVNISTIDETMINSFTIKIGIECRLSAEELAHQIQQTFCS